MPAYNDDAIRVEGLKELHNSMKKLNSDLAKQLRLVNKTAAQLVADNAAERVPVLTGRLKKSIKALGQARSATVKEGSAKIPYAGFIDFGGTINFKTSSRVIERPFIKEGRILFPALHAEQAKINAMYLGEVNKLIAQF